MSNPEVAVLQLAVLVFIIMLGFPVAFTLMALGIGFGFYAYYDAAMFDTMYSRIAGVLLVIQGIAQVFRCLICLQRGTWPAPPQDVEELEKLLVQEKSLDILRHSGEAVDVVAPDPIPIPADGRPAGEPR